MTTFSSLGFILGLIVCIGISNVAYGLNNTRSGTPDGYEEWGYVEVRPSNKFIPLLLSCNLFTCNFVMIWVVV